MTLTLLWLDWIVGLVVEMRNRDFRDRGHSLPTFLGRQMVNKSMKMKIDNGNDE